jgi:toxin YoeB
VPYELELLPKAKKHYRFWDRNFPDYCDKIDELLEDMEKHPFAGLGKPEPIKYEQSGYWSRRISEEHRLVYEVKSDKILVHSCYGHYANNK